MAREVGLKVFRTYTNIESLGESYFAMKAVSAAVQEWYKSGCANADLENVFIGDNMMDPERRPQYEAL